MQSFVCCKGYFVNVLECYCSIPECHTSEKPIAYYIIYVICILYVYRIWLSALSREGLVWHWSRFLPLNITLPHYEFQNPQWLIWGENEGCSRCVCASCRSIPVCHTKRSFISFVYYLCICLFTFLQRAVDVTYITITSNNNNTSKLRISYSPVIAYEGRTKDAPDVTVQAVVAS